MSDTSYLYNKNNSLLYAAKDGNVRIIQLLIKNGIDINYQTSHNVTALFLACVNFKEECAKILLNAGAKIIRTIEGVSALDIACISSHENIVKLLIERGAEVNTSMRAMSPLMMAFAVSDNLGIVKILLDHGADPCKKSLNGLSPLQLAKKMRDEEAIKLMEKYKTNTIKINCPICRVDGVYRKIYNAITIDCPVCMSKVIAADNDDNGVYVGTECGHLICEECVNAL